ncbi:MAG TPA: RNA 2',3'-cyclic phosphodiesterase [Alcanivorax sp.]|nr:RNA 2',3'-cyclic phosphodiesterase [Alcanivorax sp.]
MRCFIGIPVPPALAATLAATPFSLPARPVPENNLHLTLAFLGERSRSQLEPLLPALESVLTRLPAFTVTLTTLDAFPEPGARIWAAHARREPALLALHGTIWHLLTQAGLDAESRPFLPHVTLARGAAPLRAEARPGPWVLPVDSVMLYESPPDGHYQVLKEWPLATSSCRSG